jgi:hypothetical protein
VNKKEQGEGRDGDKGTNVYVINGGGYSVEFNGN